MSNAIDTDAAAARRHCVPECPGPTDHELAGLAAPHSCARTLGRQAARTVAGAMLAQSAAAADERDRARDLAVALEQDVAQLVGLTLAVVGDTCTLHEQTEPGCAHCTLLAFISGEAAEREHALAELSALGE